MRGNYIGAILIISIFGSIWMYAVQIKAMLHGEQIYMESTR